MLSTQSLVGPLNVRQASTSVSSNDAPVQDIERPPSDAPSHEIHKLVVGLRRARAGDLVIPTLSLAVAA